MAESFWEEGVAQQQNRIAAIFFTGWINKAIQALRTFITPLNNVDISSDYFLYRNRYREQKFQKYTQSVKDEFFYEPGRVQRKNIPRKTWHRHSAFLVYRQQMNTLQTRRVVDADRLQNTQSNVEGKITAETRISFHVKSIRPLPVWATALNELSVIENDMSTLRLMEIHQPSSIIAEAA
jgi:hypothetical protein